MEETFVLRRELCRISLAWSSCPALSSMRTRALCVVIVDVAVGGVLVPQDAGGGETGTCARVGVQRGGRL